MQQIKAKEASEDWVSVSLWARISLQTLVCRHTTSRQVTGVIWHPSGQSPVWWNTELDKVLTSIAFLCIMYVNVS